jgi:GH25 family lysozyme M1 (1,4-beta-N-acetylmuramidase)
MAFVNTRNGQLTDNSGKFDRFLFTGEAVSREPLVFKQGIDVSRWQNDIDWSQIASAGVEFAMLRIGRGAFTNGAGESFADDYDTRFHEYIAGATQNNIEVGVYWYSYARTIEGIRREARFLTRILAETSRDYAISYPVVLDMEEERGYYNDCPSEMAEAFLEIIVDAGYYPMIYSFRTWLDTNLTTEVKDKYAVWVARWDLRFPDYSRNYYMWQYTDSGRVSGIAGNVDLNVGYRDFAEYIRRHGLNALGVTDDN